MYSKILLLGSCVAVMGLSACALPDGLLPISKETKASVEAKVTEDVKAVLDPAKIAKLEGFKALSCDQESGLKSDNSKTASRVSFKNASEGEINIYWLNFTGKRVSYKKKLKINGTHNQPTFVTHPWLITNAKDECLGIYVPEKSENAKLTINDSSQGAVASGSESDLFPVTVSNITLVRAEAGLACLKAKKSPLSLTVELIIKANTTGGSSLAGAAALLDNAGC